LTGSVKSTSTWRSSHQHRRLVKIVTSSSPREDKEFPVVNLQHVAITASASPILQDCDLVFIKRRQGISRSQPTTRGDHRRSIAGSSVALSSSKIRISRGLVSSGETRISRHVSASCGVTNPDPSSNSSQPCARRLRRGQLQSQ
jgi:hypothetical protein